MMRPDHYRQFQKFGKSGEMLEELLNLINQMKAYPVSAGQKFVTVGFDGYVDEIIHVVKNRSGPHEYRTFTDIAEFAGRISAAEGISADLEIVPQELKLGGNAPIMANALGCLGVKTACIGAMGYPDMHEAFTAMDSSVEMLSVCKPGITLAFEFTDGKIMFARASDLNDMTWEDVKTRSGLEKLLTLANTSDIIALVNWGVFYKADEIWRGFLEDILIPIHKRFGRIPAVFFDLADPSKRSSEDIVGILNLINEYSRIGKVTLGLNENEARCLFHTVLNGTVKKPEEASNNRKLPDLNEMAKTIYGYLKIDSLLIHNVDCCIYVCSQGVFKMQGRVVAKPRILTGGGDNFNAGFCLGQLLDMDLRASVLLAMAVSGAYVQNGRSPTVKELIMYLQKWLEELVENELHRS